MSLMLLISIFWCSIPKTLPVNVPSAPQLVRSTLLFLSVSLSPLPSVSFVHWRVEKEFLFLSFHCIYSWPGSFYCAVYWGGGEHTGNRTISTNQDTHTHTHTHTHMLTAGHRVRSSVYKGKSILLSNLKKKDTQGHFSHLQVGAKNRKRKQQDRN